MRRQITYMASIVLTVAGCEEIYVPEINQVSGTMVVESRLTNNPKQNFVKLSMSRNFYSTEAIEWITDAHLELIDVQGGIAQATQVSPGYYTFSDTLLEGKTYILWISHNSDVYESDPIIMPPSPKIDTLYTEDKIDKNYRINGFGVPEVFETPGREFYIDAPITSQLEYSRFICKEIIQWEYYPPANSSGTQLPPVYGWKTKHDLGRFNLSGPKEFSVSDKVQQHPLLFLGYDSRAYLDSATQSPSNWIVIIDQYGIPKKTYLFYENLNKQFSSEGNLFDPMMAQVYGNMHCKNDPSKIILGYVDICSYRQYRYYMNLGNAPGDQVVQRRLDRYFDIPDRGYTKNGTHPEFWEYNY